VLDGRYRVGGRLGAGGMATVYLADDERLPRKVVVKVPHPALLLQEGFRKRFEHEVSSLTTLEHPNVVKIHDTGEVDGMPYAVMQHLPGGSLVDRVRAAGGRLRPGAVLDWLPATAGALDFIHRRGMIHRDVKPENILFDEEGHPFIADFGIAKAVTGLETKITRTGLIAGSPAYMAPEVARGKEAGPPFDQYALALVVYEALSGRLPHEGTTPLSVITKRAYEPPADLAAYVPDAPAGVVDAVMKALAREPEERFPSCAAFATAYATGLGTDPVGARPPTPAPAPTPAPVPRPRATTVAPAPPRRVKPVLVLGGALLVIAGIAAAAAGLFNGREEPSPPGAGAAGRPAKPTQAPAKPMLETPWKLVTPEGAPAWVRVSEEQVACGKRHGVPAWFENDLGMRFVLIPEGKFQMGSPPDEPGRQPNEPARGVTVERPFYLQATEVSNRQFRGWLPDHSSGDYEGANCNADSQPALKIAAYEAEGFCAWLTTREGLRTYRLPSEGEWEYACRAGTTGPHFWGKDLSQCALYANIADLTAKKRMPNWRFIGCDDGWFEPAPVGSFAPNPWGLHDMIGNVFEILVDPSRAEAGEAATHPQGTARPAGSVARGGGFDSDLKMCRAAVRLEGTYDGPWIDGGIRVASDLVEPSSAAIDKPAEGATLGEGAVVVKGTAKGVTGPATLLVNGLAAVLKEGRFEVAMTLPPGDQEIEVLLDGKTLALRKVKVTAGPRPGPPDGVPDWAKVSAQQAAEAKRLGVPVAFENPLGMRFVLIPAGRFLMGSPENEPGRGDDETQHVVTLTRPFYMQTTEVTCAQYRRIEPGIELPDSSEVLKMPLNGGEQPQLGLCTGGAAGTCRSLGAADPTRHYRLPTEAEWEYACRAGTRTPFFWGEDSAEAGKYANCADLTAKEKRPGWAVAKTRDGWLETAPVGSLSPNPWGLFDILGNARELCADFYGPFSGSPALDPTGPPSGDQSVVRGGSFMQPDGNRSAWRAHGLAPGGWGDGGFRVVCDLPVK
jgi:formylglycine-generating enzyme required for sulfatase activity